MQSSAEQGTLAVTGCKTISDQFNFHDPVVSTLKAYLLVVIL